MKDKLEIGTLMSGQKFTLPLDFVGRTLAIIAIRGWGKTIAATVIAEEMCEAGLPWVAIDPVGVWWGLRANPDGSPGGYPVVILGGEHGDLPLEKSAGATVAEAILQENVSCVIDMSSESKNTVRHFVADFCDRLMDLRPEIPRHIFLEEAPELVPQKPMGEQKRSLAAVDRLIRLGRNRGYGATLISQRTATIQKDVLTQCESLLAGRSIGKPDRVAMQEWIAEVVGVPAPTDAGEFVNSLSGLASGTGWFWSPQWLDVFKKIRIRRRKSYHPGETRTVGEAIKQVQLSDVRQFVERFGKLLRAPREVSRPTPQVAHESHPRDSQREDVSTTILAEQAERTRKQLIEVEDQNRDLRARLNAAQSSLDEVRKLLQPQFDSLQLIFGQIPAKSGNEFSPSLAEARSDDDVRSNGDPYAAWRGRLGPGPSRIIDALLSHGGTMDMPQIRLACGMPRRTAETYVGKLRTAGILTKEGREYRLRSMNRSGAA